MTEGKEAFSQNKEVRIEGRHAHVVLRQPVELADYLETAITASLYDADREKALPAPISGARLNYYHHDEGMELEAEVVIESSVVTDYEDDEFWEDIIGRRITDTLHSRGFVTFSLPHQSFDFYVLRVENPYCAMLVHFDSSVDECLIELSTLDVDKLDGKSSEDALLNALEVYYEEGSRSFTPFDAVREVGGVWSLIIDSVVNEYGKDDDSTIPQIVIAPPVDTPSHYAASSTSISPASSLELDVTAVTREGFQFIGGLTQAKSRLEEILSIARDPEGAALYGVRVGHFLLHGPPGTGKTSLVHAFANELNASIKSISSTDVVELWVGNSGTNMQRVFNDIKNQANNGKPLVVFFDEFESLAKKGWEGTSERVDVRKQLNIGITEIAEKFSNVVIAAATNADVQDLDPSLVRSGRLELIQAPLPDQTERIDVWSAILSGSILSFDSFDQNILKRKKARNTTATFVPYEESINPVELAKITEGFSGADFKIILERARIKKFKLYQSTGERLRVGQADLLVEIGEFYR